MTIEKTEPSRGRRPALAGPAVVAFTTEDDTHAEVRHAAGVHAKAHECLLILYAADVASLWSEAMPNQWAAEGDPGRFGDRLNAADLDVLGRSAIAGQVRDVQLSGSKAAAWLPKDKGIEALAEYALAEGVHLVFVPETLDSIDQLRALLPAVALEVVPTAPSNRRPSS
jgi:hypothetical protein